MTKVYFQYVITSTVRQYISNAGNESVEAFARSRAALIARMVSIKSAESTCNRESAVDRRTSPSRFIFESSNDDQFSSVSFSETTSNN